MKVCGHYHKNLSWFLYAANADELGIEGSRTKILAGHTPSGELDAKGILSLLADNCFDHQHKEMFPCFLAIRIAQSCAVDNWPVRNDRVLLVTAACPVKKEHAKVVFWTAALFPNKGNVFALIIFNSPILYPSQ